MNKSVITDQEFDELAQTLEIYWNDDDIQNHPHKHNVAIEDGKPQLKSGFYISNFPATVKGCAEWLLKQNKGTK
jgi:hypothetical protein